MSINKTKAQLVKELRSLRVQVVALEQSVVESKRAEAKLRESEERYRRLVELCPDLIAVHSEGKCIPDNHVRRKVCQNFAHIYALLKTHINDEAFHIVSG